MDELLQVWSNTSVIDSIRTLSARICHVSGAYKPHLCTQERIKCLDIKYTSVSVNSMKYLPQLYSTPSLPRGYVLFWQSGAERSGIWLTLPLVRWHISRWDAEPDESQWRRVKIPHWQEADLSVLQMYLWDFTEKCFFYSLYKSLHSHEMKFQPTECWIFES